MSYASTPIPPPTLSSSHCNTTPNRTATPTPKPQSADLNTQSAHLNTHSISGRPTASPIEEFHDKERRDNFLARLAHFYRKNLGVIQDADVEKWSNLEPPENYSSTEGDKILLKKISEEDKAKILDEFHEYLNKALPNLTNGILDDGICQEKVVQIIARFVQENFLYTLGRNADFEEMIRNRCGNCGDKAALFKLIVSLVKEKYPKKMNGIEVDIIVQGAKNPEYLGIGGALLSSVSQRETMETTPFGEIDINTFHFLSQVRFSTGQTVLLDLSDSSHLSEKYGKVAMQGAIVYPGKTPITQSPNKNPFEHGEKHLLSLPVGFMGRMRTLPDKDYDKFLFRHGQKPIFELLLQPIQSCLFGMYQGKEFEEAKKQALQITQSIIDLLDDNTTNNQQLDPSMKNYKELINRLSPEEKELLIQTFTETIEKNEKPFTRPPSTIGKDAFIQDGVIDQATSKRIWLILYQKNVLDTSGKIVTDSTISPTSIRDWLPNECSNFQNRVLEVLTNAYEVEFLDFFSRMYETLEQRRSIIEIATSVVQRAPTIGLRSKL